MSYPTRILSIGLAVVSGLVLSAVAFCQIPIDKFK